MRAALDSFTAKNGTTFALETAGSLEIARRLLDLGKEADVVALADEEVFPRLLMPSVVQWYARFARNRMVLAYAPGAKGADAASAGDWRHVLLRPGIAIGRSDPDLDPAGYRTLLLFQLAERHYGEPGLAQRLERASPPTQVRPKSAELVALLQAHELDYAWMYESSARGARLPFVELPHEVDLGEEGLAATYESASVRVAGASLGDSLEMRGTPIRYGISIPTHARAREACGGVRALPLQRRGTTRSSTPSTWTSSRSRRSWGARFHRCSIRWRRGARSRRSTRRRPRTNLRVRPAGRQTRWRR